MRSHVLKKGAALFAALCMTAVLAPVALAGTNSESEGGQDGGCSATKESSGESGGGGDCRGKPRLTRAMATEAAEAALKERVAQEGTLTKMQVRCRPTARRRKAVCQGRGMFEASDGTKYRFKAKIKVKAVRADDGTVSAKARVTKFKKKKMRKPRPDGESGSGGSGGSDEPIRLEPKRVA